jgi:hypothetical protein
MKRTRVLLCILAAALLTPAVWAQVEAIPADQAERAGNIVVKMLSDVESPPFQVDATAEGTVALKADGGLAVVACPARGITAEKIAAAAPPGDEAGEQLPVGVLALRGAELISDGKPFPADKVIQLVSNGEQRAAAFWLAATKANDRLSLAFVGKEKETRTFPLVEVAGDEKAPVALRFVALEGNRSGRFELILCGKYKASFVLGAPAPDVR